MGVYDDVPDDKEIKGLISYSGTFNDREGKIRLDVSLWPEAKYGGSLVITITYRWYDVPNDPIANRMDIRMTGGDVYFSEPVLKQLHIAIVYCRAVERHLAHNKTHPPSLDVFLLAHPELA